MKQFFFLSLVFLGGIFSLYGKDFPIERVRSQFPFFTENPGLIYFDSAATTHKPACMIDAMSDFYRKDYATVHRAGYAKGLAATKRYNNIRKKVAKFLNGSSPDEIIFTRGTTESLNLIALTYGRKILSKNDEILITETEHHSNVLPWQKVCQEKGAFLKIIPVDEKGEIIMAEFERLLSSSTKIVAVAHATNVTGVIHPIKEITASAHRIGAKVVIDGAQAAAHMPIDVRSLDVDFYAFSGHKIYGPTAVGVLWARKELIEEMDPIYVGGSMAEEVVANNFQPKKGPRKLEAGTPMITEVIGLGETIDFIEKIGREKIFLYEKRLVTYAKEKLQTIENLHFIGSPEECSSLLSFVIDGIYSFDLEKKLDKKGIALRTGHFCSQPTMQCFGIGGAIRISFGIYNTIEEIDIFYEELQNAISSLTKTSRKKPLFSR